MVDTCDAIVCWLKANAHLSGWVQGAGTLIALAIAIGVPWCIHRNEVREKKRTKIHQGQGLAILLRPSLLVLQGEIEAAKKQHTLSQKIVDIPDDLTTEVQSLWIMGTAGGHMLQAIAALRTNNRQIEDASSVVAGSSAREVSEIINLANEKLLIADRDIEDALDAIDLLLATKTK